MTAQRKGTWIAAALIAAATLIAYANSIHGSFVFDDLGDLVERPNLAWPVDFAQLVQRSDRPLTDLTFAIQRRIHGVDDPKPYHAVNIFIHLCNALLLFALMRRTLVTIAPGHAARAIVIACAAAGLWAVHPLTTQAVTYIVQRSESLMALCYLGSLYALARADTPRRRSSLLWLSVSVLAAALGMWCKAVAVTIPVAALLYDRCFLSGSFVRAVARRWPYHLAMLATWGMLIASGVAGAVLTPGADAHTSVGFGYEGITPAAYAGSQPWVILLYLRLAVWPHPLVLDYALAPVRGVAAVAAIGVILVFILTTAYLLWKQPRLGFVAAMFFLILAPTSSFIPVRDLAFEHRMYLPLAAVLLLVVLAAARVARRGRLWTNIAIVAWCLTITACVTLTIHRNRQYAQPAVLWQSVIDARPDNARAWSSLGYVHEQAGDIDRAVEFYRAAAAVPQERAYMPIQRVVYQRARSRLGRLAHEAGRSREAISHYQRALDIVPDHIDTLRSLAIVYSQLGEHDRAVDTLTRLVRGAPADVSARIALGDAHARVDDWAAAAAAYRQAIHLDARGVRQRTNLAIALAQQGDHDAAAAQFHRALELAPDNVESRFNYAALLKRIGDRDEAVKQLRRVLEIDAQHERARRMLDDLLR